MKELEICVSTYSEEK